MQGFAAPQGYGMPGMPGMQGYAPQMASMGPMAPMGRPMAPMGQMGGQMAPMGMQPMSQMHGAPMQANQCQQMQMQQMHQQQMQQQLQQQMQQQQMQQHLQQQQQMQQIQLQQQQLQQQQLEQMQMQQMAQANTMQIMQQMQAPWPMPQSDTVIPGQLALPSTASTEPEPAAPPAAAAPAPADAKPKSVDEALIKALDAQVADPASSQPSQPPPPEISEKPMPEAPPKDTPVNGAVPPPPPPVAPQAQQAQQAQVAGQAPQALQAAPPAPVSLAQAAQQSQVPAQPMPQASMHMAPPPVSTAPAQAQQAPVATQQAQLAAQQAAQQLQQPQVATQQAQPAQQAQQAQVASQQLPQTAPPSTAQAPALQPAAPRESGQSVTPSPAEVISNGTPAVPTIPEPVKAVVPPWQQSLPPPPPPKVKTPQPTPELPEKAKGLLTAEEIEEVITKLQKARIELDQVATQALATLSPDRALALLHYVADNHSVVGDASQYVAQSVGRSPGAGQDGTAGGIDGATMERLLSKAQRVGLSLTSEALVALSGLPPQHAAELLEFVLEKSGELPDPSRYVVSVVSRGFKPGSHHVDVKVGGWQKVQELGIQLEDQARQALASLPHEHAEELLEYVCEHHKNLRNPSGYIVSTVARGFVPRARGKGKGAKGEPGEKGGSKGNHWHAGNMNPNLTPLDLTPLERRCLQINSNLPGHQRIDVPTYLSLRCLPAWQAGEVLDLLEARDPSEVGSICSYLKTAVSTIQGKNPESKDGAKRQRIG